MPLRVRRTALFASAAWVIATGVQCLDLLGFLASSSTLTNDTIIAAGVLTFAAIADGRERATDRRTEEVLDAFSAQAIPIDASYSYGFDQGRQLGYQRGWDDAARYFADGQEGGNILRFPQASPHVPAQAEPAADATTVKLPPGLATLMPRRNRRRRR